MFKPVVYFLLFAMAVASTGCTGSEYGQEQMVDLEQVSDDLESQLANLNAAIQSSGKDANLYNRRAVLYLQQQELEKALADANEAVRLSRNEPAHLFVKAQVLRAMQREGEALALAVQAERNGYENAMLYVLLTDLHLRLQQVSKAREYSNMAYKLSPSDEYVLYYRGRLAAIASDTTNAVRNLELAIDKAPDFFEPRRELAGLQVFGKDFGTAQVTLEQAKKLKEKDALLWYYQGRLYQATEKPDSALWSYNKAVGITDTLVAAHHQIGYMYYTRGNYEQAIKHFEKAAPTYGNTVRFLTTLGSSYERSGKYQEALNQYETLLRREPTYSYAKQSIARLKSRLATVQPDTTALQGNILEN